MREDNQRQEWIKRKRRTLQHLKEQAALYAPAEVPPHLLTQIDCLEEEIAQLERVTVTLPPTQVRSKYCRFLAEVRTRYGTCLVMIITLLGLGVLGYIASSLFPSLLTPQATAVVAAPTTPLPLETLFLPSTATPLATPFRPTETLMLSTATPFRPTGTSFVLPTDTPVPPTPTPVPTPVSPVESLTGKIAYPVYKDNRKYIFIAYLDTGVRSDLCKEDASEPAISPDGSKIAFRSWNASTLGLMVSNIDGTRSQRVSLNLEDACPCWALGESLVFYSTKEGPTPRLYTAGTWEGADGTNNVQDVMCGPDPAYGRYPAWIPDRRFVYEHFERSGNCDGLWVMNQDGSNPRSITDHSGDTMPSVSPRGDKVAFMSERTGERTGGWEVYVVNIDGSGLRQLTHSGSYNSGLPTWSPDGNYIAFVSDRDNQWAVWIIKSDGSGERKLFDLGSPLPWWERISWAP